MARIEEPDAQAQAAWREWVAGRPEPVRTVAERFDPWSLYRMKSTGQRVTLASVFEDGTVSVNVSGEFNLFTLSDTNVFGIEPDDLEPCEVPAVTEPPDPMLSRDQTLHAWRAPGRASLFEKNAVWETFRKEKASRRSAKHGVSFWADRAAILATMRGREFATWVNDETLIAQARWERRAKMVRLRELGWTLEAISVLHGVTREAIRLQLAKHERVTRPTRDRPVRLCPVASEMKRETRTAVLAVYAALQRP